MRGRTVVAVAVGVLQVFSDLALGTGNHTAFLEGVHNTSGRRLRIASLHLDSDRNNDRLRELRTVVAAAPVAAGAVDVLCGDFNEDSVVGSASGLLARNHYLDVLAALGNREPTHPWSTTYYMSARWAVVAVP
jgi:endonuclease/exonuclease/phosphatase family metal-dependent hydrolase